MARKDWGSALDTSNPADSGSSSSSSSSSRSGKTAGEIVREARKEAKETGKSEMDIIREKSQAEVEKQRTSGGGGGSSRSGKTAGEIVREARKEAKETGKSEVEVIKEKSQAEVSKPTKKKTKLSEQDLFKTPYQRIQEGEKLDQRDQKTTVEQLPSGMQRKTKITTVSDILSKKTPAQRGYVKKEKDVDIPVERKGGITRLKGTAEPVLFARATEKKTSKEYELIGGELKPKGEVKTVKGKKQYYERAYTPYTPPEPYPTVIEPYQEKGFIERTRRRFLGKATEEISRGQYRHPEHLETYAQERLPILKLKQPKVVYENGKAVTKGYGKQNIQALLETERQIVPAVTLGAVRGERVSKFAEKQREQAMESTGLFLDKPSLRTGIQTSSEIAGYGLSRIGEFAVKSPAQTVGAYYGLKSLPALALPSFIGYSGYEVAKAPGVTGKVVTGGALVAELGAFYGGAKLLRGARGLVGTETIRTPVTDRFNIFETRPLKPYSEKPFKIKKVVAIKEPTGKVTRVVGRKKVVAPEAEIERATLRQLEKDYILDEATDTYYKEVPIKEQVSRDGYTKPAVKALTSEFTTVVETKTFGLQLGTKGLPIYVKSPKRYKGLSIDRIAPGKLQTQPKGAVASKARFDIFKESPELIRQKYGVKFGEVLKAEKGLSVTPRDIRKAEFEIEGLSRDQAKTFFKEVEVFASRGGRRLRLPGQKRGTFFGTFTTLQLPKRYQKFKIGDIDVESPIGLFRTKRGVERLQLRLGKKGIETSIPREEPLSLKLESTGEKIFETKVKGVSTGEETIDAFAGFKFGKQRPVKFGKAKATRAGEQVIRKLSGASYLRGRTEAEGLPKEFESAGLLPKGKRFKDLPDFIAQGLGALKLRESVKVGTTTIGEGVKRYRTGKAKSYLEKWYETFSPEQKTALRTAVKESTRGGVRLRVGKTAGKGIEIQGFKSPTISRPVSQSFIPTKSRPKSKRPKSPRTSYFFPKLTYTISPKKSPRKSPKEKYDTKYGLRYDFKSPKSPKRSYGYSYGYDGYGYGYSPIPKSPKTPATPLTTLCLRGAEGKKSKRKRSELDRKYKYTPIVATVGGLIKAPRISKKSFTGFEIRGFKGGL